MDFSYTIFPVKKNKCTKNFKIMRKSLFNYSLYSHPEIGNFRVWQPWPSPSPRPTPVVVDSAIAGAALAATRPSPPEPRSQPCPAPAPGPCPSALPTSSPSIWLCCRSKAAAACWRAGGGATAACARFEEGPEPSPGASEGAWGRGSSG
jgi:hypothetical protein